MRGCREVSDGGKEGRAEGEKRKTEYCNYLGVVKEEEREGRREGVLKETRERQEISVLYLLAQSRKKGDKEGEISA